MFRDRRFNKFLDGEATTPNYSEISNSSNTTQVYIKKDVGEDQNQYVRYASKISNNDLDFLATLNQENGLWTPDRQATNGETSYGFCQIHSYYHPEIVKDPRFFSDPYWQLDKCWELYKGGTRFYGADLKSNSYDKFTLITQ